MIRLTGRSVCSKKVVEDFWDVHFPSIMVEGSFADSDMDGFFSFSGNLFAVLVYYLEVGNVGSGVVLRSAVYVNLTGDMTIVFFYSIFQTSAGFSYVRKDAVFFWAGPFIHYCFLFKLWWNVVLRIQKDRFKGVGCLEDDL